jgi:putative DNA primase/helicase
MSLQRIGNTTSIDFEGLLISNINPCKKCVRWDKEQEYRERNEVGGSGCDYSLDKSASDYCDRALFTKDETTTHGFIATFITQGHIFKTLDDNKIIYVFREGYYQSTGENVIRQEVEKLFQPFDNITSNFVNEVIGHIRRRTYISRRVFNKDPSLIVVENGVYNLKTGKLEDFDPDIFSINKIPVYYDSDAKSKFISRFLEQVCPDPDYRKTLIEWIGYHLYTDHILQNWMLIYGEENAGKSRFLELLTIFLGEKNVTHVTLQDIVYKRFMVSRLNGKLANIRADIPPNPLKYAGTLKELTGNDWITADIKHRDPHDFKNYAKLTFSCNQVPKSEDKSTAFHKRHLIIPFTNKFSVGDITTDPHIIKKLSTKEELSGLLNIALAGLKNVLDRGSIFYPFQNEEKAEHWERFSDPLYSFVQETLLQDIAEAITKSALYTQYVKYATKNKIPILASNVFSRKIKSYLISLVGQDPDGWISNQRAWRGIRFKNTDQHTSKNRDDEE